MHDVLPIYCETALNTLGTFPAEPVNTITSFAPVILGILAIHYLIRHRHTDTLAYTLAILTILTGLGSVAWHAYRTQFTLIIDAVPGLIYFVLIAFAWAYYVGNRYIAIGLAALLAGMILFTPPVARQEYLVLFIAVILALAAGLVIATWFRKPAAFKFGLLAVVSGTLAGTLRTLDLNVCETIPVGTHFFWHIFLGIAAYTGVRLVLLLREQPATGVPPTRSASAPGQS